MIKNKTALVTGAAGTMGMAVTKMLLNEGCRVVMADVNQARLDELASALGDKVMTAAFDVSKAAEVEAAVSIIEEKGDQ